MCRVERNFSAEPIEFRAAGAGAFSRAKGILTATGHCAFPVPPSLPDLTFKNENEGGGGGLKMRCARGQPQAVHNCNRWNRNSSKSNKKLYCIDRKSSNNAPNS